MNIRIIGFMLTMIACLTGNQVIYSQNLDDIQVQFKEWNDIYREEVYGYLDRSIYVSGDDIWFNAYCIGSNPVKSKVLYVELVNWNNIHILGSKLIIEEGQAHGKILIPDSLGSGFYYLKAYTNWMKNFDPGFHFSQQIYISNRFGRSSQNENNEDEGIIMEISPEGGDLIIGHKSKVGIKMWDSHGKKYNVTARVFDLANIFIDSFQLVDNYGSFYLTPEEMKEYYVILDEEGNTVKHKLPGAEMCGFNMFIERMNSGNIRILARNICYEDKDDHYIVTLHHQTDLIYCSYLSFDNSEAVIEIPDKNIPRGIVYVTLFSERKGIVSERLLYHNEDYVSSLKLNTDKDAYDPRDKVIVEIENGSDEDKLKAVNVSLSVRRAYHEDYKNVFSAYNELHVDDYCFSNEQNWSGNVTTGDIQDPYDYWLDCYLLFQSGSRYSYKNLLSIDKLKFSYAMENKGLTLSGCVQDSMSRGVEGLEVLFSVPDSIPKIQYYTTDKDGRFYFLLDNYYEEQDVFIQYRSNTETVYNIVLDEKYYYKENKVAATSGNRLSIDEAIIRESIKRHNIMEAYVSATVPLYGKEIAMSHGDGQRFYGEPKAIVYTSDFINLPDFQEVSREILPFVRYRMNKKECMLTMTNQDINMEFDHPLLLVDGVPVYDYCAISSLGSEQLERIEIQNNRRAYGDLIFEGVLALYTFKGNLENISFLKNGMHSTIQSYDYSYQFISPDYSDRNLYSSITPDFRDLLYWDSGISFDHNDKSKLEFYTSDEEGEYVLRLVGITTDNVPLCLTKKIRVINE